MSENDSAKKTAKSRFTVVKIQDSTTPIPVNAHSRNRYENSATSSDDKEAYINSSIEVQTNRLSVTQISESNSFEESSSNSSNLLDKSGPNTLTAGEKKIITEQVEGQKKTNIQEKVDDVITSDTSDSTKVSLAKEPLLVGNDKNFMSYIVLRIYREI